MLCWWWHFFFRLQRVRQRQEYGRLESESTLQNNDVTLFEDYAVLDRDNKMFRIGNLVRLICNGNRNASLEYQRPVPYSDPKRQSITAYLQLLWPCPRTNWRRAAWSLRAQNIRAMQVPLYWSPKPCQCVNQRWQPLRNSIRGACLGRERGKQFTTASTEAYWREQSCHSVTQWRRYNWINVGGNWAGWEQWSKTVKSDKNSSYF